MRGHDHCSKYGGNLNNEHLNNNILLVRYQDVRHSNRTQIPDHLGIRQLSYIVQWGSEIRSSLDFEWSKRGWFSNSLNFEWDLKSGSPNF